MFEGPGPSSTRADGCNSGNEELGKGGLPFKHRLRRARLSALPFAGGYFAALIIDRTGAHGKSAPRVPDRFGAIVLE
jgi:hypothetical protein